jgi:ketosteroid isomerase-like protein
MRFQRPRAALLLAASLLLGSHIPAHSQQSETHVSDSVETRNKAIVKASFDAWRNGTGGPFDLLDEDATWTIVGRSAASKTYATREAFMTEVIRPFNARMRKRLQPTIRGLYADGSMVVVFFDAAAEAQDGKPYTNTYAWFLEMRAGRIASATAFFDTIEFNELWQRVAPKPAG